MSEPDSKELKAVIAKHTIPRKILGIAYRESQRYFAVRRVFIHLPPQPSEPGDDHRGLVSGRAALSVRSSAVLEILKIFSLTEAISPNRRVVNRTSDSGVIFLRWGARSNSNRAASSAKLQNNQPVV